MESNSDVFLFVSVFFLFFFSVDEWREYPNTTKTGPSSARQRNAFVFRWRADDGPTLNAGLIALWRFKESEPVRNPILIFFSGGDPLPPGHPHLWIRALLEQRRLLDLESANRFAWTFAAGRRGYKYRNLMHQTIIVSVNSVLLYEQRRVRPACTMYKHRAALHFAQPSYMDCAARNFHWTSRFHHSCVTWWNWRPYDLRSSLASILKH